MEFEEILQYADGTAVMPYDILRLPENCLAYLEPEAVSVRLYEGGWEPETLILRTAESVMCWPMAELGALVFVCRSAGPGPAMSLETARQRMQQGDESAQFWLGCQLCAADVANPALGAADANRWLRRAALDGHREAQFLLAQRLLAGDGLDLPAHEPDMATVCKRACEEAESRLRSCAGGGDIRAMLLLAYCCRSGLGATASAAEAMLWEAAANAAANGEDYEWPQAWREEAPRKPVTPARAGGRWLRPPPGPAGFIAGTLVHTKNGTVAIETLRAGDLVLVQRAGDDAPECLPLPGLVSNPRAVLRHAGYRDQAQDAGAWRGHLFSTADQLFWVESQGWVRSLALPGGRVGSSVLRCLGEALKHSDVANVYESATAGVGWIGDGKLAHAGFTWDFSSAQFLREEPFDKLNWPLNLQMQWPGIPYTAAVFNLQLQDDCGYFVGADGVLVSGIHG